MNKNRIKIGMFVELIHLESLDFTKIENGNPGVGGTAYCILTVANQLARQSEKYEVIFYCLEELNITPNITQIIVETEEDAVRKAAKDNVDLYIFVAKKSLPNVYKAIDECKLKSIAWVHNFIDYPVIKLLQKTEYVKKIVFVGQQHYDYYIDDEIIFKSTFIYNIVHPILKPVRTLKKEKIVMYVGMLGPAKGFHILAKQWKKIVEVIPDARLYVLGSSALYDRKALCGPYGLAEKKYEKKFMQYLTDEYGKVLDSVFFCGNMGMEKEEIYRSAYVGVTNPSGVSETFCLSAVEMETRTIPVVSYKGKGLLDTVIDEKTGYLNRRGKRIASSIIRLLQDDNRNHKMGLDGKVYVDLMFAPDSIMPKWEQTIASVLMDKPSLNEFSGKNMQDCMKWFKFTMYKLKISMPIMRKIPSYAYAGRFLKTNLKKILQ